MPRHRYSLDELLAFWDSGQYQTAAEIVEVMGLDVSAAAVSKQIRRHRGHRPKRATVRTDKLRRRVIARMVELGQDVHRCSECQRPTIMPMYIRELDRESDDIASLVFVCRRCKRPGDV